jgi:ATP-binding cassette subfamily F protein 3
MIKLNDIEYSIGERILFSNASASLDGHDRVGLVGANGSGKTTLLRIMKGEVLANKGSVDLRKGARIGYLPQEEIVLRGNTLIREALRDFDECLTELTKTREQFSAKPQSKALMKQYEAAESRFEAMGGYKYESEAHKVLTGLGFVTAEIDKPVSDFSSGWQMRIVLARILLSKPDLLLLDEPTNHLDIESIQWLEDYLRNFRGAIVIVSHDRYFLDRILHSTDGAAGIWEIDMGTFRTYRTDYTGYLQQAEARKQRLLHRAKVQEKRIREIREFIARNKANKSKARLVRSREKYLARMEQVQIEQERRKIRLDFPSVEIHSRRLVELQDVTKTYGAHSVFKGVDLVIEKGDRVALIGKNGAGKSTLSRILCGVEKPSSGIRRASEKLRVGMFSHELVRELDLANTVLEEVSENALPDIIQKIRNYLGIFLFSGDAVLKRVGVLSGGEKTRLVILKAMLKASNLLVLDEPTFHLDRESTEAIKHALRMYGGTVVLVTHDRDLIQSFATRIVELKRRRLVDYPGDFSYYLWKRKGLAQIRKTEKKRSKKESRMDKLQRALSEKEKRRSNLRASFMRQSLASATGKTRKLFEEYQRLTKEVEELVEEIATEVNSVHSK